MRVIGKVKVNGVVRIRQFAGYESLLKVWGDNTDINWENWT